MTLQNEARNNSAPLSHHRHRHWCESATQLAEPVNYDYIKSAVQYMYMYTRCSRSGVNFALGWSKVGEWQRWDRAIQNEVQLCRRFFGTTILLWYSWGTFF